MTAQPGRRARVLAAASAAGLVIALAGSAIAGPLPPSAAPPAPPAALPPGSVETPGRNELVSTPQQDGGASGGLGARDLVDQFTPPTISADGRYVVFLQQPGPGASGQRANNQVVVHDRREDRTTFLEAGNENGPVYSPTISADGTWIAYMRSEDNEDTLVLVNRRTGARPELPSLPGRALYADQPALNANGQFLAVRARARQGSEILVLDRSTGRWETISVDVKGEPTMFSGADAAQPAISWDGRFVAFTAGAVAEFVSSPAQGSDYRQVYVRDRSTGRTRMASVSTVDRPGRGWSWGPAISGDGTVVAFQSYADDLVAGDDNKLPDIFAWPASGGGMELVSIAMDGRPGNGHSAQAAVNGDGTQVAFVSGAMNLVPGDTTPGETTTEGNFSVALPVAFLGDIFVRDRGQGRTSRVTVGRDNDSQANGLSTYPSMSGTGRYIAFTSASTNLVRTDSNGDRSDVFVRERPPRITASPNPLDFGAVLPASLGVTREATIRSSGITPARIGDITIAGRDAGDFVVAANPCSGQTLPPGATCAVQVLFVGTANGDRIGTLRIASNAGDPVTLRLTGSVGRARLELDPKVGPPGTVVIATGSGFPAFAPIALRWSVGITAVPLVPVVTDENGSFVAQVLVLPRDREGARNLRATATAPGVTLDPVTARFTVTRPTMAPPGSGLVQVFAATPGEPIILRR